MPSTTKPVNMFLSGFLSLLILSAFLPTTSAWMLQFYSGTKCYDDPDSTVTHYHDETQITDCITAGNPGPNCVNVSPDWTEEGCYNPTVPVAGSFMFFGNGKDVCVGWNQDVNGCYNNDCGASFKSGVCYNTKDDVTNCFGGDGGFLTFQVVNQGATEYRNETSA